MFMGVLTGEWIDGRAPVLRRRLSQAAGRLRAGGWPILQTAVAASLAWYMAGLIFGHEKPFVAPIAAVISVGAVSGQTLHRATEWIFGVAFGIAVADLIIYVIGTGTIQIGIVVALAMSAAMVINGGLLLVTEVGVSALLASTLDPSATGLSPDRFLDALVGGGAALAVSSLFPNNPRSRVEEASRLTLQELAATLRDTATALRAGDLAEAERALQEARQIDERVASLKETLQAGFRVARYSPPRRGFLGPLGYYATAAGQLDLAVRNTRVLARAAASTIREGRPVPRSLYESILDLTRAVESLGEYLENSEHPTDTRRYALRAAEYATVVLEEQNDLETSLLVGQIRSTAVDLLGASGMDSNAALHALQEATRRQR